MNIVQILDLGMHNGNVTAMLHDVVNKCGASSCSIHGFEPHPRFYRMCQKRFTDNPQIEVHNLSVSDHSGTQRLYHARNTVGHSLYADKQNVQEDRFTDAQVVRLSEWLETALWNPQAINILKMNIEGAEWNVLRDLVEGQRLGEFDLILGTPDAESDIHKIPSLKARLSEYEEFLHHNNIQIFRFTDYQPENNFDLQSWLNQRVSEKLPQLSQSLLISTFCDASYAHFLPALVASAQAASPPLQVNIYVRRSDLAACRNALQICESENITGWQFKCIEDFLPPSLSQTDLPIKILRWLVIDPEWHKFQHVLLSDVDIIFTDPHLLERRLRHMQAIGKPYSNSIRSRRTEEGKLKVQGVHFFRTADYLPAYEDQINAIAQDSSALSLHNEAVLAILLDRGFGLPEQSRLAPNHHHGIHLRAFSPGTYTFAELNQFIDPAYFSAEFDRVLQTQAMKSVLAKSNAEVRTEVQRAKAYRNRLRFGKAGEILSRVNGAAWRVASQWIHSKPLPEVKKIERPDAVLAGHLFRSEWLPAQPVVIDVGYKYGEFAIEFFRTYGGKIYGLEPGSESFQRATAELLEDAALSDSIELHLMALWNRDEPVDFFEFDQVPQSNSVFARHACHLRQSVPGVTLPGLRKMLQLPRIDLLKIDCEGAEWSIFSSLQPEELQGIRQISMELHREFETDWGLDQLVALLEQAGFEIWLESPWGDQNRLEIWGGLNGDRVTS